MGEISLKCGVLKCHNELDCQSSLFVRLYIAMNLLIYTIATISNVTPVCHWALSHWAYNRVLMLSSPCFTQDLLVYNSNSCRVYNSKLWLETNSLHNDSTFVQGWGEVSSRWITPPLASNFYWSARVCYDQLIMNASH